MARINTNRKFKMKWSRDHGLTCGFRVTMATINVEGTHTFRKIFEFDQTFKVTKVNKLFSGFDLCDIERSVKMCNVI